MICSALVDYLVSIETEILSTEVLKHFTKLIV